MTGPRAPLSVRINDGKIDRHVDLAVRELRFRKTAPGGFHSASMRLVLPRSTFTDLGPNDKLYIYDERTGATVWEGFTENPGTMDGPEGQGFDLSAMGTTILASDESRSLMYVDNTIEAWQQKRVSAPGAAIDQIDSSTSADMGTGGIPSWQSQFPSGQPIGTGSRTGVSYYHLRPLGLAIATFRVRLISGKTDAAYSTEYAYSGAGSGTTTIAATISTSPGSYTRLAPTHFPVGTDNIHVVMRRTGGATNIADDNTWIQWNNLAVVGQRVDRYGNPVAATTDLNVRAFQVVEDLLGRMLRFCDDTLSTVEVSTWRIDQLAYLDGAKAQQVLDDLSLWEPDFLWEMLHSTQNGYVFNYRAWPTTVRYEIDVADGYDAPGADVDLCNRIAVFWTDDDGAKRVEVVGADVPALGTGSPVLNGGNLVVDPSFENASPWTGLDSHFSRDNTDSATGAWSMRGDPLGAGTANFNILPTATIPVIPGQQFRIGASYKTTGTFNGTAANSKIRLGDQNNALIDVRAFAVNTSWTDTADWVYTVPASGVTALQCTVVIDHTVGTIWFDDLEFDNISGGTPNPSYSGRIRDADPITLPDGRGSLTNAQRIGGQVLAAKADPPKAATAVVKRPIIDRVTGSTVMPWEIEPGYLVRVRETGDVLRLTEVEYVDSDVSTSLTLGEPQLTVEQRVARLSNKVG